MGCPKCGYSGHNSVFHWGTDEIECERCRHDYVPERKSSKKKDESSGFLTQTFREIGLPIDLSNDVWMTDSGKVSVGHRMLGSRCIGQKSPLIGDNSVFDHRGNFVGRVFEAGGRAYLDRRCW